MTARQAYPFWMAARLIFEFSTPTRKKLRTRWRCDILRVLRSICRRKVDLLIFSICLMAQGWRGSHSREESSRIER